MFFEDEKDNLDNLDALEDLELDLDEDGDDESISWDDLLKDETAHSIVSVSPKDQKKPIKEEKAVAQKPSVQAEDIIPIEETTQDDEVDFDLDLADLAGSDVDEIETADSAKDAFDVFGGDISQTDDNHNNADNIMDTDEQSLISQLDEMDISSELEGVSEDEDDTSDYTPPKAAGIMNNIPVLAGIILAAVLVVGSLVFIFAGPKNSAPVDPSLVQQEQTPVIEDETAGEVNLPNDTNKDSIPVVNDENAKKLKPEKKVVLSVESAGRLNPFLPTIAEFDKNIYSGVPAQSLLPPDTYGEDMDAQELMKVSVSGILFDNVKPSAIITISGIDYFVQKGDMVDDYRVVDINRQSVVIKKGKNIYKAGVGERFNQKVQIDGSAVYQGTGRRYQSVSESDIDVTVRQE